MYLDKSIELIDESNLKKLQVEKLNKTIKQAFKSEFYSNTLKKYNISENISFKNLDEFKKNIPFTTKNDLRLGYPYGMLAVDKKDVVRMHASSGTTGTPTVIFLTKDDLERATNLVSRSLYMAGIRNNDVFQNMMTYGLFTGGLFLHYGAEKLGCYVIPVSSGNTLRQLKFISDFKTTVAHITPSYALHLLDELKKNNIDPADLSLERAVFGAEPYSDYTKSRLEKELDIKAFDCYGLSEMNGPAVAFQCQNRDGLHLWEDYYIAEIINPDTGKEVPEGQDGELVLTILTRDAMPVLRYRTKDLVFKYKDKCPCGRTHMRISRIKGRSDDMMIISGVNVFPSQIEQVIMKMPEVGNNYQIILLRHENLDKMHLKIELNSKYFTGKIQEINKIKEKILHDLRNEILISPKIEFVNSGSLPPSTGKAKRIIDKREI